MFFGNFKLSIWLTDVLKGLRAAGSQEYRPKDDPQVGACHGVHSPYDRSKLMELEEYFHLISLNIHPCLLIVLYSCVQAKVLLKKEHMLTV